MPHAQAAPERPTQIQAHSPLRDPALDGLRGAAVLLVFFFHYGGGLRAHNPAIRLLGHLSQAGWAGVEVFFVLSGYLITAQLLAQWTAHPRAPHSLRNFYVRRALRILPLYLVTLLACAWAAMWAGARPAQLRPLLVYLAFLQNIPPWQALAQHAPPPLPVYHLWSLAVEEQFYLLWPLLLLLIPPKRWRVGASLALFGLSCLFRLALFQPGPVMTSVAPQASVLLPTRAGALLLGSALACWRPPWPAHILRRTAIAVGLAALGFWLEIGHATGSFLLRSSRSFTCALPAVDLLAGAVILLCLVPGALHNAFSWRPLAALGRISYGFYIVHLLCQPIFDRLGTLLTGQSSGFLYQGVRLAVALPLSLLMATLSFHLLERPFLRLKRRFPLEAPPVAAPPSATAG